ncbi:helix-hairpin-helix domain-containing protein [Pontibacter diazotrophicus]|uniref:Helix-hairpin-helix domain-containing protein n=1 Tax=Pontibacter diazotrophicus TaxID=1400979 RepID=A0A3D8LCH3_9BACT|nr:helix-hairpin-helix domain-containing protein [Pontibacter diazotrophicus]RDV15117.1 helix-hairpin-helix domain-containing protein [Pontibacter diazotrophicus]
MKKIRHWVRRYFGFSQSEVNGFLLLLGIMVLLTAAPFLFHTFYTPTFNSHSASDKQTLDSLVAQLEARQPDPAGPYRRPTVALQLFNPNQLTAEEWQDYGLPKYLAQRILNYRNKIGDFSYKAELGEIYGLPDSVFQRFYPYIQLPEEKPARYSRSKDVARNERPAPDPNWNNSRPPRERFILAPFNINTADTTQLKQIRGIGSKLSARIVKYRDGLGGFYTIVQLKEVYGLQPEIIDSLQKYTFVPDTYAPQQLNLNTVTADELKVHPYVSSNAARAIVAYREQHGNYERLEDVQKVRIVTSEMFEKLRPYLQL